jgi:GNAT superfamily N-acetyltransferase
MTAVPKPRVSDSGERLRIPSASDIVIRKLGLPERHYMSVLSDGAFEFLLGSKHSSPGHNLPGANTWCAGAFSGEIFVGVIRNELIDIPGLAVTSLFVVESWRRNGIGSALLQATEPWALERGCNALRIHCSRSNWSMRAFLERLGGRFDLVVGQIVAEIRMDALQSRSDGCVTEFEGQGSIAGVSAERCFNVR